MLTVMTWFWKQEGGRATYTHHHVNIWADMVRRNLTIPHRLACVTEHPEGIDPSIEIIAPPKDFEDVRIPTWTVEKPQCLRRIAMFAPDAGQRFGERFVSMDMDCVIAGNLDSLFATTADFKMYRGTTGERPYNGSMMLLTAGARPQVYTEFSVERAIKAGQRYVGSDQAWISYILGPGEAVWDYRDGVFWYQDPNGRGYPRLMFFPGYPKPWQLAERTDTGWFAEYYRRSPQGRALLLGYGQKVWDEAIEATEKEDFDAVIASPEAAAHWPVDVLAIAKDDRHAERLARMYGFSDYVFCGRSEDASDARAA